MSYANMFRRTVKLVPGAAPAGRAFSKRPPTYTVLPMTSCDHATPSICTVASCVADGISAVRCATGAGAACTTDAGNAMSMAHAATMHPVAALTANVRVLLDNWVLRHTMAGAPSGAPLNRELDSVPPTGRRW